MLLWERRQTAEAFVCIFLRQSVLSEGNRVEVITETDGKLSIVYQSEIKEETNQ